MIMMILINNFQIPKINFKLKLQQNKILKFNLKIFEKINKDYNQISNKKLDRDKNYKQILIIYNQQMNKLTDNWKMKEKLNKNYNNKLHLLNNCKIKLLDSWILKRMKRYVFPLLRLLSVSPCWREGVPGHVVHNRRNREFRSFLIYWCFLGTSSNPIGNS